MNRDVWLLHGFASDRLSWAATAPMLGVRTCHTPDLPGHGKALGASGDGSPETLLHAVTTSIDAGGAAPVHVVGHSLGGGLALMLAKARPDLVASLFLIAPVGLGSRAIGLTAYPAIADEAGMRAYIERLVARPELISRQTVAYAFAQLERDGARSALHRIAVAAEAAEPYFAKTAESVADLGLPRYVVWGARDRLNPPDLAKLEAFGEHTVEPDAGHLPHIEAPARVNVRLADFLANLD